MAAVVTLHIANGATPTEVAVSAPSPSSVRFKTADDNTIDSNNPLPIPAPLATTYSYWKHLFLIATGSFTEIDNIKIYPNGSSFGTGLDILIGTTFPTHKNGDTSGYDQATGTVGTTGDIITDHANLTAAESIYLYSSISPLIPGNAAMISETGNKIDAANETTNYIVLQVSVDDTAQAGIVPVETITILYDEI